MSFSAEPQRSRDTDVCIFGAGPHGLAAAIHLSQAEPSLRVSTIDPSGHWLSTWHEQMARAEVPTLRSPCVHSPSPDPSAFVRHLSAHRLKPSGLPYDLPTVDAFAHFCHQLIEDSGVALPLAAKPVSVTRDGERLTIVTDEEIITAGHLVVATNPHRRHIPEWVWPLLGQRPGLVEHAGDLDLRNIASLQGERVAIIGGGLSAAHLACGAAKRGAEVHLVARRPLTIRNFDTDPGWLGPKELRAFEAERDPNVRLASVRRARGGGSIPPWMRNRLYGLVGSGELEIHEAVQVRASSVAADGTCHLALDDQSTVLADRVWLATGNTPDISTLRCLGGLVDDLPLIDGYPLPDEDLRLGNLPIHIMGRLAALALGPAAGNLWGAQRAAERIAVAVIGSYELSALTGDELAPRARRRSP